MVVETEYHQFHQDRSATKDATYHQVQYQSTTRHSGSVSESDWLRHEKQKRLTPWISETQSCGYPGSKKHRPRNLRSYIFISMRCYIMLYYPASCKRMSQAEKQSRIGPRKEELCQCSSYHCHPLAHGLARGVAGLLTRFSELSCFDIHDFTLKKDQTC